MEGIDDGYLSDCDQYELNVSVKPVESKPKPIISIAPKPVEVKPVEVKPVEVKPVEVKPVEVKPVEVKPVEVKPVERIRLISTDWVLEGDEDEYSDSDDDSDECAYGEDDPIMRTDSDDSDDSDEEEYSDSDDDYKSDDEETKQAKARLTLINELDVDLKCCLRAITARKDENSELEVSMKSLMDMYNYASGSTKQHYSESINKIQSTIRENREFIHTKEEQIGSIQDRLRQMQV
jgi:hypothetical protein